MSGTGRSDEEDKSVFDQMDDLSERKKPDVIPYSFKVSLDGVKAICQKLSNLIFTWR